MQPHTASHHCERALNQAWPADSTTYLFKPQMTRPGCITRVPTAEASPDWLEFAFPPTVPVEYVKALLDGHGEWIESYGTRGGHRTQHKRGGLCVLADHPDDRRGVRVIVDGDACRQLEREGLAFDWQAFFARLRAMGARFSRVDLALDDRTGSLSIAEILRWTRAGLAGTRAKDIRSHTLIDPQTGAEREMGITFGSGKSLSKIRIYDRAFKTGTPGPWVRVELECHKGLANALAAALAKHGCTALAEVVRRRLDFKVRGKHPDRCKWKTQPKWDEFLGECGRIRLRVSSAALVEKDARTIAFVEKQAPRSLSRYRELKGKGSLDAVADTYEQGQSVGSGSASVPQQGGGELAPTFGSPSAGAGACPHCGAVGPLVPSCGPSAGSQAP